MTISMFSIRRMAMLGLVGGVAFGLSACQSLSLDRGSFGGFKRSLNTTSHGYQQVPDPTGTASTAIVERFEVQPGDCGRDSGWSDCAQDRERSELSEGSDNHAGSTYWYGWDIYFPDDYPNIYPTKTALGQFHQHKSHPVWMFQNGDGGYSLDDQVFGSTRRYYKLISEKDLRGKWHRIELQVKWGRNQDGFFKVWVNGNQKVDYTGTTLRSSATYFKYGIYRSFMSRYRAVKKVEDVPGQIVYYANVRRANTRQELAAPLPATPQ
ncbi:polysaccharide lyase [Thalassospira alkalitolerans]|uniref:polysaccharide lyase n=1 Tax=Thalassospira alkalitolerans TaxID=1293890 RepID=UPI003AA9A161